MHHNWFRLRRYQGTLQDQCFFYILVSFPGQQITLAQHTGELQGWKRQLLLKQGYHHYYIQNQCYYHRRCYLQAAQGLTPISNRVLHQRFNCLCFGYSLTFQKAIKTNSSNCRPYFSCHTKINIKTEIALTVQPKIIEKNQKTNQLSLHLPGWLRNKYSYSFQIYTVYTAEADLKAGARGAHPHFFAITCFFEITLKNYILYLLKLN